MDDSRYGSCDQSDTREWQPYATATATAAAASRRSRPPSASASAVDMERRRLHSIIPTLTDPVMDSAVAVEALTAGLRTG
jgi:hypothetical protein